MLQKAVKFSDDWGIWEEGEGVLFKLAAKQCT